MQTAMFARQVYTVNTWSTSKIMSGVVREDIAAEDWLVCSYHCYDTRHSLAAMGCFSVQKLLL